MKKSRKSNEYKLIHIILGLAIGFFLGGVVVYYGFNRQNVSLLKLDISSLQLMDVIQKADTVSIINNYLTESDKNDQELTNNRKDLVFDSKSFTEEISESDDSILMYEPDSVINQGVPGQLVYDSYDLLFLDTFSLLVSSPQTQTEYFRVEKDRLVNVKTVQNPKFENKTASTSYTILDSIMGKDASGSEKSAILVEFWETPLSSKGYMKGKNKLVLYGFSVYDFGSLIYYENTVYLKYLNQYYPLELTSEFKSLKPVSDLGLIEKLQQL